MRSFLAGGGGVLSIGRLQRIIMRWRI